MALISGIPIPKIFNSREKSLIEFVNTCHADQKRKYEGQPYVVHLIAVANTVKTYTNNNVQTASALCHDLFEDTTCNEETLKKFLKDHYTTKECTQIIKLVWELTDRYTKKEFPDLNRFARKQLDAERLKNISADAATIKLADFIDNIKSIIKHDKGFARVYLSEIKDFFPTLIKGNAELFKLASELSNKYQKQLELEN